MLGNLVVAGMVVVAVAGIDYFVMILFVAVG